MPEHVLAAALAQPGKYEVDVITRTGNYGVITAANINLSAGKLSRYSQTIKGRR
jgi:hypothetical protein